MNIRQPFVAGSFYPENPIILRKKIEYFISNVSLRERTNPKILIVPHAGYNYSGQVAAHAYKQLTYMKIKKVILIGCSHQTYLKEVVIWASGKWKTPLGEIYINEKLAKKMIDHENIIEDTNPHLSEHSLEVQLPFLQVAIKNSFTILPIMLGEINKSTLTRFCKIILQNLDSETVLIISSDFSHYPTYEVAKEVDEIMIQSILTEDTNNFINTVNKQLQKGYEGLVTCACGQQAIVFGMTVAKNLGLKGKFRRRNRRFSPSSWILSHSLGIVFKILRDKDI